MMSNKTRNNEISPNQRGYLSPQRSNDDSSRTKFKFDAVTPYDPTSLNAQPTTVRVAALEGVRGPRAFASIAVSAMDSNRLL